MKKLLGFAVAAAAATVLVFAVNLSRNDTPVRVGSVDELLDPTLLGRHLCGKDGQERGLFFRPSFMTALAAQAQTGAEPAAETEPEPMQTFTDDPPLWESLGDHSHPVTTDSDRAQAYFDQGLRLAFGFNHWEAGRSFRRAREIDPTCAMCYWGEALVLGPNINAPMSEDAIQPAFAAMAQALALTATVTAKERALIEALSKRYSPDPFVSRDALDQAYADAMAQVYADYPDDADIAALYAEAVMDTSPWDYWERDFRTPHPEIAPAIAAAERALELDPEHTLAIHLYIHLMEASQMPEKAEPYADKLASLMPNAGHMVHMPAHIYFRIGRYIDSLNTNKNAVLADERYLAAVKGSDIYRYGYYPHNVHFVLVSAQMADDSQTVIEFADKLDALIPYEAARTAPWVQPIKAAPLFAYAQFGDHDAVLAREAPPDDLPYLKGLWHYARGAAFAMAGEEAAALTEAQAIADLQDSDDVRALEESMVKVPAGDVLRIAELLVRARVDQARGNIGEAISGLQAAAEIESSLNYTEPPYWYYPIEQTLGAVYLQNGQYNEAAEAFTRSLVKHPNNAWSLYGLMKAQEALDDPAAEVTAGLFAAASIDGEAPDLNRL